MVEKRRGKQRKQLDEPEKPSKDEYAVAKHLRFNIPSKEGKLMGMTVQYFIASKAVDSLLDSKWASSKEPLFTTRSSCVDFCQRLLEKGLFHRAARVERKKDKKKKKTKESEEPDKDEERKARKKAKSKAKEKEKEKEREKAEKTEGDKEGEAEKEEKPSKEKEETEKKDEEKKKKKEKKLKIEMHDEQRFKDGDEVYVWIYDPVRPKTFIIGLLLVLGAIAVCLFPLWPPEVRLGVYYVSLAAAGFVGVILSLCVVRLVLFCLVWCVTFGNHHFWFLPNLTEDVGFFDSFKPLYTHSASEKAEKTTDESSSEKDTNKTEEKSGEKDANSELVEEERDEENGEIVDKEESENHSANEEEVSEKGTPESGSDNGNGYELVDREDIEEIPDDDEDVSEDENDDDDDDDDDGNQTRSARNT